MAGKSTTPGSGIPGIGPIVVDAEALGTISEYLQVPSDTVAKALRTFQSRVVQIGPAWGSDSMGQTIEAQYRQPYNDLILLLQDLVDGFDEAGTKFSVASHNVNATEEANRS
ncbi:hypothetical protein ACFFX1_39175 [Dactylosporangium sucinum]|uniref:WXG100 family type VII secretion target n=1 Tax=Dactylosporangium sucinum TaxID=1424081 RepID=A0A917WFY4_9ACTN|nr:hypothetical protein [Dactylosporangium sucinum]GGM03752.1 hypothetical protein GCM10007977_001410 [Dactylosporangium sucinum]